MLWAPLPSDRFFLRSARKSIRAKKVLNDGFWRNLKTEISRWKKSSDLRFCAKINLTVICRFRTSFVWFEQSAQTRASTYPPKWIGKFAILEGGLFRSPWYGVIVSGVWKHVWRCYLATLHHLDTQRTLRNTFLVYPVRCYNVIM